MEEEHPRELKGGNTVPIFLKWRTIEDLRTYRLVQIDSIPRKTLEQKKKKKLNKPTNQP